MRTERSGRSIGIGTNALASSVVLSTAIRQGTASIGRGDFRRELHRALPEALRSLQHSHIAPVDVAQASIGPGMAIFSRYSKVLEADGSAMSVRSALQLINEALDEYLNHQEGEVDSDTRFAITWFEGNQFGAGAYGDAETLAKARNVAVSGVAEAGIIHSAAGKVRLLKRSELPEEWDPTKDDRLTVWEATQHLIKRLEEKGEQAAAELVKALGGTGEKARDLAYRVYSTCERKGWADEARAYNGLVIAWPELEKLAQSARPAGEAQGRLL
jgi:putative DNA methylase